MVDEGEIVNPEDDAKRPRIEDAVHACPRPTEMTEVTAHIGSITSIPGFEFMLGNGVQSVSESP